MADSIDKACPESPGLAVQPFAALPRDSRMVKDPKSDCNLNVLFVLICLSLIFCVSFCICSHLDINAHTGLYLIDLLNGYAYAIFLTILCTKYYSCTFASPPAFTSRFYSPETGRSPSFACADICWCSGFGGFFWV